MVVVTELEPCPFCGGKSSIAHNGAGFTIVCENPGDCFAGEFGGTYTTNIQAEDAWNARANKPEPAQKHFAQRARELRNAKGVTQREVAELLGLKERSYRFYEASQVEPTASKLITLANYYNVSVDYLVGKDV